MNDIEKILKENGIIIGIATDNVDFFDTGIDLTNEPKDNLRAMRRYPDSIVSSCDSEGIPDSFADATVAISYPNDMAMLKRVHKQLHEIGPTLFVTLIIEAVINRDKTPFFEIISND